VPDIAIIRNQTLERAFAGMYWQNQINLRAELDYRKPVTLRKEIPSCPEMGNDIHLPVGNLN
jgi:hypothetical protein